MKTPLQLLIAASCAAALIPTAGALGQSPTPAAPKMKAIVYHEFGSHDVLRLEEVDKPVPNDNQILVKVRAVSANPLDWHFMEGTPYLARLPAFGLLTQNIELLGVDYAETVEEQGQTVR